MLRELTAEEIKDEASRFLKRVPEVALASYRYDPNLRGALEEALGYVTRGYWWGIAVPGSMRVCDAVGAAFVLEGICTVAEWDAVVLALWNDHTPSPAAQASWCAFQRAVWTCRPPHVAFHFGVIQETQDAQSVECEWHLHSFNLKMVCRADGSRVLLRIERTGGYESYREYEEERVEDPTPAQFWEQWQRSQIPFTYEETIRRRDRRLRLG